MQCTCLCLFLHPVASKTVYTRSAQVCTLILYEPRSVLTWFLYAPSSLVVMVHQHGYALYSAVACLNLLPSYCLGQVTIPSDDGSATIIMDLGVFMLTSTPEVAAALPSDEAALYQCFRLEVRQLCSESCISHRHGCVKALLLLAF